MRQTTVHLSASGEAEPEVVWERYADTTRWSTWSPQIGRVEPDGALQGAELRDGTVVPLEVLFLKPEQRLPPLVQALGLALDEAGYVRTTSQGETSLPDLFAAGDLTTPLQAAMMAAYQGAVVGWTLVHTLNLHGASSVR